MQKMQKLTQSRNFSYTYNNPEPALQEWFDRVNNEYKPTYHIAQLEKGDSGTPHIQGCLGFNTMKKLTAM